MRIKLSIDNNYMYRNINIQNIEFKYKYGSNESVIYFKCHKKYEHVFNGVNVIFHDKNGKELFRSRRVRADFRYYEFDKYMREDKVRFLVEDIEFEDLGYVSREYLIKIFKRSCNARIARETKVPTDVVSDDFERVMRHLRNLRIYNKQTQIQNKYRIFFPKFGKINATKVIKYCIKFITKDIESKAPI